MLKLNALKTSNIIRYTTKRGFYVMLKLNEIIIVNRRNRRHYLYSIKRGGEVI